MNVKYLLQKTNSQFTVRSYLIFRQSLYHKWEYTKEALKRQQRKEEFEQAETQGWTQVKLHQ